MGWLGLAMALGAAVCSALSSPGMFVAMGLGLFAATVGLVGWRRRDAPSNHRLAAAAAIGLGLVALLIGAARYALTLAALSRIRDML